jgi:hypothetical protein
MVPSTPRSSKWPLFSRFPHQNPASTSSRRIRSTFPGHLSSLDATPK